MAHRRIVFPVQIILKTAVTRMSPSVLAYQGILELGKRVQRLLVLVSSNGFEWSYQLAIIIFDGHNCFYACIEPPSECQRIKIISIEEQSVSLSWKRPVIIGRDDFYYAVKYSDGETVESNPVVNLRREVHYFIDGLKYATEYTITVTVKNGVSDQDPENKHLRRCELRLKTQEGSKLKSLAAYKCIINISDEQGVIHDLNIIINVIQTGALPS